MATAGFPTVARLGDATQIDCAYQTTDKLHLALGFGPDASNNGNLLSQTITANSSYSWTQYYAYDGVNRLAMASENAAITGSTCPGGATWRRQYGYDHFGNRWIAASLDTLHMATPTAASAIDPATNRLASGTYDAAGNMTAYPFLTDGGSMSYDANNKMKAFTKTGVSVDTKYDAAGRRVRKVYNGETTVWVYDAFGRLAAEYTTETQTTPAGVYYRTTDHLGSTRIVSENGVTFDQVVNAAANVRIVDGRYSGSTVSSVFGDPLWGGRHQAQFDKDLKLPSGTARVMDVFGSNSGIGAWTPYRDTTISINPVASQHANRSDVEFEALIFHELMHNITVLGDNNIRKALGIAVQTDSTHITQWFLDNCVTSSDNY